MIKLTSKDRGTVFVKYEKIESVSVDEERNATLLMMISGNEYLVTETPGEIYDILKRNGVEVFE